MRRPHFQSRDDLSPFASLFEGDPGASDALNEPERRAGFILASEFEQIIQPGFRYVIEEAGLTTSGHRLWSVYLQRATPAQGERR